MYSLFLFISFFAIVEGIIFRKVVIKLFNQLHSCLTHTVAMLIINMVNLRLYRFRGFKF